MAILGGADASSDPHGSTAALRPLLKWAGGKRWQLPHLRGYWEHEAHRRLVEPFCGGLAVAFGLMPGRALLNDVNPHVINFYAWLQRGLTVRMRLENRSAVYYANRREFNRLLEEGKRQSAEAAGLFYYLNRTGYNGLCRFNQSGGYNVPFGRYARINYRTADDFLAYRSVLGSWQFTNLYFSDVPLQPDDFVYADPPYDVEFRQYSKDGFSWEEQVSTAQWLARHRGPVILSNQATARITELYRDLGYTLNLLRGPRRISCTGDRTPAPEVLATRNLEG